MKISEIITDKYKLRIEPNVYYDLLADVREAEEEQEPCDKCVYSTSEGCQYDDITETIPPFETSDDAISRQAVLDAINTDFHEDLSQLEDAVKQLPPVNSQKPKSEWQHDHEILRAYSDGANEMLDKIRAEIVELWKNEPCPVEHGCLDEILQIIDKYKSEGSGET